MTLIPGDGIGPEISASVQQIFSTAGVSSMTDADRGCLQPPVHDKCSCGFRICGQIIVASYRDLTGKMCDFEFPVCNYVIKLLVSGHVQR